MALENNGRHQFKTSTNYYEEQLSPFGKKVLHIMLDNWKLECEHIKNIVRQQPVPEIQTNTKKVFNFRNSEETHTTSNYENRVKDISPHSINSNKYVTQEIPKSTEPIKILEINNGNSRDPSVRNSFIYQSNYITNNEINSSLNINDSVNRISITPPFKSNIKLKLNQSNTVDWNDMFDIELITPNVDPNNTEYTEYHSDVITNMTTNNLISNEGCSTPVDNFITQTLKAKKQTKITDTTSKKIKNGKNRPKNIVRKQKYTKSVSNWLKDIPSNTLEEITKDFEETKTEEKNDTNVKYKIKKVVQAQLANKDGIMKFSKPKKFNDNQKYTLQETVHKDEESTNEKKKTKFVTPIKSQTSVKEIVYEICIVDQSNIQKIKNLFSDAIHRELIAVLIYRNGFSQLNSHHTDDSCVPEGVMLCVDNMFYYCKDDKKAIIPLLENNEIICYDGKNILIYLMSLTEIGDFQLSFIDVKIGGSLLEPDNPPGNFKELQKLLAFVPEYTIATECSLQKCAWYITLLKECVLKMKVKLSESSLWNVFTNIEMRLLPILAGMEHRGIKVDIQKLKSMEDVLLSKIKIVEQECYKAAGKTFQINSSMQVSAILYDELKLDAKSNVKIRETLCKGAKSTSETMLRSLVSVHPLPKLILEYRHLHKAHSTFLVGIAHYVNDGIVKTTWEQTAAATGRIASNNPNLQAIPKAPFSLNMFSEPDIVDPPLPLLYFRSVYIPRDGYTFLAADFKHVECRVFAHAAADTGLLALLTDGQDLFKALAAKWLNKSEMDVTSDDRERTKRIVYASLYGAGLQKLMEILGISYEQTLAVNASFNRTFPCLKSFGRSVIYQCEQNDGRLSTVCGRVRRFTNISSSEYTLKSQAERQAINFIVQGSAADLCKIAMVMTKQQLKNYYPHLEAHLVLQIHDELVWEVRIQDLEETAAIIKEVMENCGRECGMNMTLPVSMSFGSSWGDITELKLLK